uniref:Serine/threonine-protein kinase 16 n=1 Tax=Mandrillus leucophaeus TaxID=9568 RepID=A0A2K5YDS1_MANLE
MGHALCVCSRGTVIIDNKRYLFIQKLGEGFLLEPHLGRVSAKWEGHPTPHQEISLGLSHVGDDHDPSLTPLAHSGFSYVDLVEGLHDGHFYALKRILCHEQQDREEAQREADMHRLFSHPNILRLVAYCLRERGAKHEAWLLLPFFKRGTLWNEIERLKDKGNFLTEDQILWLLLGICRGLEAIHAKAFLSRDAHRDLKPTNILLGDEGQPVLMDLACINVEGSRQALTLQDWAAQRCTISYRAPELFSVQSHCVIDERTDVWSLGCVLYAMMFGEGPYDMVFQKGDSVALAVQNQLSIPQSPRHSSALRQLLASMMTVDPHQRPHIPLLLSQLEALQPPAPGQHTTQI